MRVLLLTMLIATAGCLSSGSDDIAAEDPEDSGQAPPEHEGTQSSGGRTADEARLRVLLKGTVEVPVSVGTPAPVHDTSPWLMGYKAPDAELAREGLTGLLMEIHFTGPDMTLGGFWAWHQETDTGGKVVESVMAWAGETDKTWLPATLLPTADPDWFVSAASDGIGPMATANASADVAVTAFYGGEPDPDYSAFA